MPSVSAIIETYEERKIPINTKELIVAIKIIENHTGVKLAVPSEGISYKEFLKIIILSKIIDTQLLLYRPILITMTKEDALKLIEDYKQNRIDERSIVKYQVREMLLDQDIVIDNTILNLAAVKPSEDLQHLSEYIVSHDNGVVSIKLVSTMDQNDDLLLHIKSKIVDKRKLLFDFPENVKAFIEESNLREDTLKCISSAIQQLNELLDEKMVEHEITMGLFEDPEENWKEIKMRIRLKKELSDIYKNLESPIYNLLDKALPEEVSDKLLIKLEPF